MAAPAGNNLVDTLLQIFAFADDTTVIGRMRASTEIEAEVTRSLARFGEHVHPGKSERMRVGPVNQKNPETFVDAVRLLGAWIECDGGSRTDTNKRLQQAQRIWRKLCRQLLRYQLSAGMCGRIVATTVIPCLLYGSEARSFTYEDMRRYQVFINKIVRHITWRPSTGGMLKMEGHRTIIDLNNLCGLRTVREYILHRQLGYIGHVARYGSD